MAIFTRQSVFLGMLGRYAVAPRDMWQNGVHGTFKINISLEVVSKMVLECRQYWHD